MKTENGGFIPDALRIVCGTALFASGLAKAGDMPADMLAAMDTMRFNGNSLGAFLLSAYPWLCMYAGGFLAAGLFSRFMAGAATAYLTANTLGALLASGPAAPGWCALTAHPLSKWAAALINAALLAAAWHAFSKNSGRATLDALFEPHEQKPQGRRKK